MPRSSLTGELVFDPEIEKTAKANRKAKRQENNLPTLTGFSTESVGERKEEMAAPRTLRELATPNVNQQPFASNFLISR